MSILVVDNYDSFTFNLVHLLEKLSDEEIIVLRNDEIDIDEVEKFDRILLSPGPGLPSEAGLMPEIIKRFHQHKNIFGVCLGLQAIVEFYGGKLKNLDQVIHGRPLDTLVIDKDDILFSGVGERFAAGRYHSWVADKTCIPKCLVVSAIDEQGEVMAIRHQEHKVYAVQFHPESIMTPMGEIIMANWLKNS